MRNINIVVSSLAIKLFGLSNNGYRGRKFEIFNRITSFRVYEAYTQHNTKNKTP